jgi:hypothetical protein
MPKANGGGRVSKQHSPESQSQTPDVVNVCYNSGQWRDINEVSEKLIKILSE